MAHATPPCLTLPPQPPARSAKIERHTRPFQAAETLREGDPFGRSLPEGAAEPALPGGRFPGEPWGHMTPRLGRHRMSLPLLCGLALVLTAGGCSFGPRTLERTHGRYAESVRLVEAEQVLRNLVHLRYNEGRSALEVTSIAAQYELNAGAEARPFFVAPNPGSNPFRTFTNILPDLTTSTADRPTFTLTPADDEEAVRRLLTPLSADTLVLFIQSTWPVATVLRMWAARLNGVPNGAPAGAADCGDGDDSARFLRAVELLQAAAQRQLLFVRSVERLTDLSSPLPAEAVTASAVVEAAKAGLEYRRSADGKSWAVARRERGLVLDVTSEGVSSPEMAELAVLLNLKPGEQRYELVTTSAAEPDPLHHPRPPSAALDVQTRSTYQTYVFLSNGVETPPEHLASGVARPANAAVMEGLFAVHCCMGHKPPPFAYLAVPYRGYWYYLDDRDPQSKMTFALLQQLSRLDFSRRVRGGAPVLTLPAGR